MGTGKERTKVMKDSGALNLRAYVYIDGFNLYYRALRNTKYKWLDLDLLCRTLLSPLHYDLRLIRYFTAKVKNPPNDPKLQSRQQTYFRALNTLPNLEIHFGAFLQNRAKLPDAKQPVRADGSWNLIEVLKSEEKGSDVNLATYLLFDAFKDRYDIAVLITNDSDFEAPIRLVSTELGKRVDVFCPARHPNPRLAKVAGKCDVIWRSTIRNSQFPDNMMDSVGAFHRPPEWR